MASASPRASRNGARSPRRGRGPTLAQFVGGALHVEVDRRRPTARTLYRGLLEMSYVDLADPLHLEFEYTRHIGDVIDLAWPAGRPLSAVHLGGAACTLPRYLAARRPRSRSEVYELDSEVLEIAQAELGLRPSRALRVRVGDARELLGRRAPDSADLIIGDAFDGVDVPPQMRTVEFAALVRRVLRHDGVYVLNLIDSPPLNVARGQAATLACFGHRALIASAKLLRGRAGGNVVLVASDRELPVQELSVRAAAARPLAGVLDDEEVERFAARVEPLSDAAVGLRA